MATITVHTRKSNKKVIMREILHVLQKSCGSVHRFDRHPWSRIPAIKSIRCKGAAEHAAVSFSVVPKVRNLTKTSRGDKLVPFGDVQSTPSFLTNRTADRIHMIARMNGSQLQGYPFLSDKVALMTATFSMNAPEYVDPQNQKAELYTNGSNSVGFKFNAASARFSNYTEMLKIAGFDS